MHDRVCRFAAPVSITLKIVKAVFVAAMAIALGASWHLGTAAASRHGEFLADCTGKPDGIERLVVDEPTPSGVRQYVVSEIECRGGAPDGRATMFYPSGQRMCRFDVHKGVVSGPFVAWHPNGAIAVDGTFQNEMFEGRLTMAGGMTGWTKDHRAEVDIRDGETVRMTVFDPQGRARSVVRGDPVAVAIARESIQDNACATLIFIADHHGGARRRLAPPTP